MAMTIISHCVPCERRRIAGTVIHNLEMKIKANDINLEFRNEYDMFNSVFYKGEPFTGVLEDGLEIITYENGIAHGEYILYFKNGEVQAKEIYDQGTAVESEWHHENGVPSSKFNKNFKYTRWNDNGIIVQKENINYFPNGQISHINKPDLVVFYSPDGNEIYRKVNSKTEEGKHKTDLIYKDELMHKWHYELLNKIPFEHSDGNRIHWIYMWFWEVFKVDQREYFKIQSRLLSHPNKNVIVVISNIIALHNFHKYIESENESNKEAYELIRENTLRHDKKDKNRDVTKVDL